MLCVSCTENLYAAKIEKCPLCCSCIAQEKSLHDNIVDYLIACLEEVAIELEEYATCVAIEHTNVSLSTDKKKLILHYMTNLQYASILNPRHL